ncbi:MAG: GcrA family cell cycle regulator [Pseudomonadota bacterium]
MAWTDERVELLKKYWAEGLSASQIAGKMGGVTRNAVIGKVHRLGLSGRATPAQPKRGCTTSAAETVVPAETETIEQGLEDLSREPAFVAPITLDDEDMTTVSTLQRNMCKWPIGDPASDDFRFCGQPTALGKSYCAYHARMAFQPSSTQRKSEPASPPAAIPQARRRAAG